MDTSQHNVLIVINYSPYGTEHAYNGLRLGMALVKRPNVIVRVFLVGDGVGCVRAGQKTPQGYYNVERMAQSLVRRGEVAA